MPKFLTPARPIRQQNVAFQPFPHAGPRAETKEDGSEIHKFRFAYPRGTLDARMSGKELAAFVVREMISILSMRLLDYTDYVCSRCEFRSRLQPEDTICPICNHRCTTANRTEIQEEFARIFSAFALTPPQHLDELLPWVKVTRAGNKPNCSGAAEDDQDYIELNLHDKKPWAAPKLIFDAGGGG